MEYPGLRNNNKSKEKVSDLIIVDNASKLPYNSKSGSIAEVVNKGVKELALDAIFPHLFYIHINNTSIGDIAQTDDGKILSILRDLEAVYYTSNNLKKTINYLRVAILGLIYREYEIDETLHWKNLNNIKIFTFRSSKDAYLYNGEEWEKMDYVQKSDFVFDKIPTQDSSNLLTSGVIYNELINKADLINGKVPSDLLPSYVDDVLEFPSIRDFPQIGEPGKIYIDINATTSYRWTGSIYKEIQSPIELDEYPILGSTNAVESGGVYSALLKKLDIISDLSEIRLGAAAGATALLSFTETDPTVPSYVKSITQQNITDWNNKQSVLTFDNTPTTNSINPVTSGGIKTALDVKADKTDLNVKQDKKLVVNIAINGIYVTADKTYAEILAAYNSGKDIELLSPSNGQIYRLVGPEVGPESAGSFNFQGILYDSSDVVESVCLLPSGEWTVGDFIAQERLTFDTAPTANSGNPVTSGGIKTALNEKQPKRLLVTVTMDNTITADKSYQEISEAFQAGADIVIFDGFCNYYHLISYDAGDFYFKAKYYDETDCEYFLRLSEREGWSQNAQAWQEALVSGINIKTINNTSLLGSGNISIEPNEIASITTTESTTSGGNNTVTINTTDGTSKTFNVKNGKDGAVGVDLGEVALVQTTGDSEESVMSQKAVTEYGRKVTAEDLAGTSDWVKVRLTEEGWEFGEYINSSGTTNNNAGTVATPYIPIRGIENHEISLYANLNLGWAAMCFYDENKTKLTYIPFNAYTQITKRLSSYSSDIAYVRTACLQSDISKLNIVDNDTGEVLFDGKEKLLSLCEDRNIPCDTFQDKLLSQELGSSSGVAVSQNVVNNVQRNVDAIGRRSYGITSVWNANKNGWISRSEKRYDVSSEPWVDVVSYNVSSGTSGNGMQFFGFCPTITSTPNTANDYIGFVGATWDVNFIVRRNGTTVHTTLKAISSFSSQQVLGFRLDFRRKTILIMWRTYSNGTLGSTTIDLSSYDINLGKCYLYSTMGHCSYVANTYVGWNSPANMTDFSAFFGSITVGNFANITELAYPDADIDGSDCGTIGNLMSNYSATQDANEHWVATIDKSSFTDVNTGTPSKVVASSYLYSNWDCLFYVGKIKASGGTLQFKKSSTGGTIKDVFDITSGNFITGVDGVYTIQDGHTVEVRAQCQGNGKNRPFMFLGTCTVEMWDWVGNVSLNSNLTPMNYDGSKIFGGISFLHNRPELVVSYPLITTSNYFAQGFMKYSSNKLYARVYNTSSNTYVDKQISNT